MLIKNIFDCVFEAPPSSYDMNTESIVLKINKNVLKWANKSFIGNAFGNDCIFSSYDLLTTENNTINMEHILIYNVNLSAFIYFNK